MTAKELTATEWWESITSDPRFPVEQAAADLALKAADLMTQAARARADIDQNQLANLLGVSKGRVSQVLKGDGNVHVATLAKYLRALGYELNLEAEPVDTAAPPLRRSVRADRHNHGFRATYIAEEGIYEAVHYVETRSRRAPTPLGTPEYVKSRPDESETADLHQAFDIATSLSKVQAL